MYRINMRKVKPWDTWKWTDTNIRGSPKSLRYIHQKGVTSCDIYFIKRLQHATAMLPYFLLTDSLMESNSKVKLGNFLVSHSNWQFFIQHSNEIIIFNASFNSRLELSFYFSLLLTNLSRPGLFLLCHWYQLIIKSLSDS